MADEERARSARPDGAGHTPDTEAGGGRAGPRDFWSAMWDNALGQPGPLLVAVMATAVSVTLMAGGSQSQSPAAAGEGREVPGVGATLGGSLPVSAPAPPAEPAAAPAATEPRSSPPPSPSRQERYRTLAEDAAATCPGLPAGVLFAISAVESDHGRNKQVSRAGARGPMQFLPGTWRAYAVDGDGDGRRDITNAADAVHTAARHLCLNGGADPQRLRRAIWNYNHSKSYVERVLDVATAY